LSSHQETEKRIATREKNARKACENLCGKIRSLEIVAEREGAKSRGQRAKRQVVGVRFSVVAYLHRDLCLDPDSLM